MEATYSVPLPDNLLPCLPTEPDSPDSTSTSRSPSTTSLKKPVETPIQVVQALAEKGLQVDDDNKVTWIDGSPLHPRHWPLWRKLYDTGIIIALECGMTLISNTGTILSQETAGDLGITEMQSTACFVTTYMLGQAFGGLFFPPFAEAYGTRWIWASSTFVYALLNMWLAFQPNNLAVVVIVRLLTGMVAAIPSTVACGALEDMWDQRTRGWAFHAWISAALVGLVLGPPVSTALSLSPYGWPAVFGIATAGGVLLGILAAFMNESRPAKIKHDAVKMVQRQYECNTLSAEGLSPPPTVKNFARDALWLPSRMFITQPIVFSTSIMGAFVYGLLYLFSESFTIVFVDGFGLDASTASWITVAFAVAYPLTIFPRLYERKLQNKAAKRNEELEPEHRLFGFYIAAPVLAIGLWWFGATIRPMTTVSVWIPIASLVLIGYAVIEFDNLLSVYLADSYPGYAASATAPMGFLRCIMSGTFPLFADKMFESMGTNSPSIAVFILAICATIFCGVAVCFWKCSRQLRERSNFNDALRSATSATNSAEKPHQPQQRIDEEVGFEKAQGSPEWDQESVFEKPMPAQRDPRRNGCVF